MDVDTHRLRVPPADRRRAVHGPASARGETHFELLRAFASDEALTAALEHASREGYLTHEFGDAMVVI